MASAKKETKELTVGISAFLTLTMWVQWREQLVRMCCSPLLGSLYLWICICICICICMSEKYNSRGCAAPPCWVLGSGRGQPLAPAGDTSDQLGKIRIHPNIQLVSLIQPSSRSDTFIPPFIHKDISLSTQHYYCAVPRSIFTDVWAGVELWERNHRLTQEYIYMMTLIIQNNTLTVHTCTTVCKSVSSSIHKTRSS